MVNKSGRQEVTGIIVNEKSNLPRQYFNKIRGEIGCLRHAESDEKLKLKVLGRLGHVKKVVGESDPRYLKLKAGLNGIKLHCSRSETFYRAMNWIVENEDGDYGTAFHVKNIGWITACHISLPPAKFNAFKLYHPDSPDNKYPVNLDITAYDIAVDYLVFKAPVKPIVSAVIAPHQIENGESCVLTGYPNHNHHDNSVTAIESKVTSIQTLFKAQRLVVGANIFHGMSGGSVFNDKNQLVGVVTHGNEDGGKTILQSAFTSIHLIAEDIATKDKAQSS